MKILILTFFCNLLSSVYLQEANHVDDYNLNQPSEGKRDWPVQSFHTIQGNFYGQAQRSALPKPCARQSPTESEPDSQVLKAETLTNTAPPLKPQSLRNAEYDRKKTANTLLLNSEPIIDDKLYKSRNSVSLSNPVIDSAEENHHEIIPPINNEIQEDNAKQLEQLRVAPPSDSLPDSSSRVKLADSRRGQSPTSFVQDSVYDAQPENPYISDPNNAIASEPNEFRTKGINKPSKDKSEYPGYTVNFNSMETQTLPSALMAKLLTESEAVASSNKCSHDKESENSKGHSRRSMSSYKDEDNAKELMSNDEDILRYNNDHHIESHIDNENALTAVLNAEKITLKPNNEQGLRSFNKSKSPHEKSVSRVRPQFNEARREMIEPTKGAGVMGQSALMLMQSERICYACSTANNPSCWAPDRRTTVKYCRKGNNACLTKTFGQGSTFTLIRDCGRSCDDTDTVGIMPRYKSCSICHSELCNGAYSINGQSIIFALILIPLVKYLN